MNKLQHLYIFTLEIDKLSVGNDYNPLPSHLTLVSRFWSAASPERISSTVSPLFKQTKNIELIFGETSLLGPNQVSTYLVHKDQELKILHSRLVDHLNLLHVDYVNPQYIGRGWQPHVSKRDNESFSTNRPFTTHAAYLIAVTVQENRHMRSVKTKFDLSI